MNLLALVLDSTYKEIKINMSKEKASCDVNIRKRFTHQGQWSIEYDNVEWIDEDTGLTCIVRRHTGLGSLSGYIRIPEEHSLYKAKFGDKKILDLEVHGGISFVHFWDKGHTDFRIGFDCGHAFDYKPLLSELSKVELNLTNSEYRSMKYVREECKRLAKQIRRVTWL